MKNQIRLFRGLMPQQWYALTFIIPCILCLSWLFLYYLKVNARIDHYKHDIKIIKKQYRTLIKVKTETTKLIKSIKRMKNNFLSLTKNNKNLYNHQQMTETAQYTQKIGLSLHSCIAEKRKIKDWFSKQNVVYDVTGTPQQISRFITMLSRLNRHLKCKKLSFRKTLDKKAHLTCTLQFLTFKKHV